MLSSGVIKYNIIMWDEKTPLFIIPENITLT
jgi:hypothetical protein